MVTVYFWIMIAEPGDITKLFQIEAHVLPMAAITIDYCLVKWTFTYRHMFHMFITITIYGYGFNCPRALAGNPAYKLMSWDSFGAVLLIHILYFLFVVIFIIMIYVSKCKLNLIG